MDWELYSFIIASHYRKSILVSLFQRPKTPTEIKNETGFYLSHVSNVLKELVFKKLVLCLSPSRSKGRVYGISDKGREIVTYLKKHDI